MRPRPYLSYSQLQLVERSPDTYRRVYVEGKDGYSNSAMDFGSKIGNLLESNEMSGYADIDLVLSQIPRYELPEHEIFVSLNNGRYPIPLIAKLDSVKIDLSAGIEYKTGKGIWTQSKADKNDQITFYDTCIWLKTGHIPAFELIWAETVHEYGKVRFTGKIKRFKTARNMSDILRMMKRMKDAWALIQKITDEVLV